MLDKAPKKNVHYYEKERANVQKTIQYFENYNRYFNCWNLFVPSSSWANKL